MMVPNERAMRYVADQLRRLAAVLERHAPLSVDISTSNHVREVPHPTRIERELAGLDEFRLTVRFDPGVRLDEPKHQHERWQIRDEGSGPYCLACGEPVSMMVLGQPIDAMDDQTLHDLLAMVGVAVSATALRVWTDEQRQAAARWAASVHMSASDNDVPVLIRPEFLRSAEQSAVPDDERPE